MPEICPILGLGIYFAVLGFASDGKLFKGGNQYSRFLKLLKRVLSEDVLQNVLSKLGMTVKDFGTHSARKGAAAYASSCSTSGPSAASICLRAGWTLPGVQDKYVRFEAAGDMIVGRFVSGLPFDSPNFATLPPFFSPVTSSQEDRLELEKCLKFAMDTVYSGAPPSLRMNTLKRHVHGSILTIEALESAFAAVLARSQVSCTHLAGEQPDRRTVDVVSTTESPLEPQQWGGGFHRAAEDFVLPNGTLRLIWQHWCVGSPALRMLSKHDMATRVGKVRLAELQRLMHVIEGLLSNTELRRAKSSTDCAGLLYEQIKSRLPFSSVSSRGRERRLDHLSWKTLAREMSTQNLR
ncbi:hypothetical protein ON010_g12857 [Phytophthora cinnamomi]|nr:hypothetical protein ON010_g12857 [Phytophthora cinnamomi]